MNTNKKAPKLRFKGFTDDWEQRKLSEITARVTRKNGSQSDLPLTISAQDGLVDQRKYFNRQVASRDMSNYYLIKKGEFAYNKSYSEGYPFGAVKRLDYYDMGALSTLYILFEITDKNISSDFIVSYYMTHLWHKEISKQAAEGARNHGLLNISTEDFFDSELNIPNSIEEQVKIGNFIKQFDKFINLYQRKLDKMKLNKRVLLQKLFPQNGCTIPEVRFKGFTDAWKQRKLGECVDISTGYPFDSQDFNDNGEYLVITNGNIQENTPFVLNNVGNRIDLDDSLKKYILDIDDLLITMDGTVGRVAIVVDNKLVLAQRVCRIKSNEPYYIYQLLSKNDFIQSMDKIGHGGTIKHISLSEISEYKTFYPKSQKERIKISIVLTNYDKLITLHQCKLDRLISIKKALLQQLFV